MAQPNKHIETRSSRLMRRLRSLVRDQRGVSAVEFAMILPMMLTLYIGSVEVSNGVTTDRKISITARTLADLVSQSATVTNADKTNIFSAATAVMTPYPINTLSFVVSAVNIDAQGVAKIGWSDAQNASPRAVNSTVTIPAGLAVPNTQLIWSEVKYVYTPTMGYVVTGSLNLTEQSFIRPRQGTTVNRVP